MAWIQAKKSGGFVVREYVDRSRNKTRSKYCSTREKAESLKAQWDSEALARDVLANTPGIPGWEDDGPLPAADDRYAFTTYATQIIDADADLRDTTRALYLRNLRLHVAGTAMGQADIRSITPDDVREWWLSLNVGVGARRNAQQLVAKVFNRAVLVGDLDVSPLKRAPEVKRPSAQRREEYEPLTVAEVEDLAESATRPRRGQVGPKAEMTRRRDRLEILLMAYAGLRAGELGGLRVTDLVRHADRCQLRLRQQVVRQTGRPAYTSPLKTKAARRTVPVPCSVYDELTGFLADFPPAADGRVFHGPNGELRAHNDINHAVQAAGKRIGLDVNAHQLRHTAVSLLIDDGANPRAIQSFVGHSDVRMTLGTYGHLFDYGGDALAASMERRRTEHHDGS